MQKIDIDEMKEQTRRTQLLHEYCKDPQIEMRIKAWIISNGPNVRPPILFDIEKDRWFWVNRDQRKKIHKQEKKDANKTSSKLGGRVGLDGNPIVSGKPISDEVFNNITRVGKNSATGNNEREVVSQESPGITHYEVGQENQTTCRDVTELNSQGQS